MPGIEDVTPHITLEGADELIAQFKAIGAAAETAFSKINDAADKVGGAGAGIEQMAQTGTASLKELGTVGAEAFAKIVEAATHGDFTGLVTLMFGKMAGAIAGVVQSITEFVDAQAHAMETLSNLAEATGMSTGELLGMRDAFASVGISTQGFERAIGRIATTIGQEWASIQEAVRTSADNQARAMLGIEEAALGVQKAYHNMHDAFAEGSSAAVKDSEAILSAAENLRKAGEALADASMKSQQNSNSLAGAQLSLREAQQKLDKDSGKGVSKEDEQSLKIDKDRLAVSEARLRVQEAATKKQRESDENEDLQNRLSKARQEKSDAEAKADQDTIKNIDKIKQAHLDVEKAILAEKEAAEKMHQEQLKDIPAISKEIDAVANGTKKWEEVTNHTEISAQNLYKAIMLAASGGASEAPKTTEVFREMENVFKGMGDSTDAMSKKLEIMQRVMGAGFRAGNASAAQMLAVFERGPEALEKFKAAMENFAAKLGIDKAKDQLNEFNSTFTQTAGAIDLVKTKLTGVLSVPLNDFFNSIKESLQSNDGLLGNLVDKLSSFLEKMGTWASKLGSMFSDLGPVFSRLLDLISRLASPIGDLIETVFKLGEYFGKLAGVSKIFDLIKLSIDAVNIVLDGMKAAIGGLITAFGYLIEKGSQLLGIAKGVEEGKKIQDYGKGIIDDATKNAKTDINHAKVDTARAAGDEAGAKKLEEAAAKEKEAADKASGASDKHSTASDKHDTAATKHDAAAEKHGSAASKQESASSKMEDGVNKLSEAASNSQNMLGQAADKLTDAASELVKAAGQLASAAASKAAAGGKADGGPIKGPGTATNDGAGLFALSDGEYVIRQAAVQHYGAPLFDALNGLSVGGFATGGAVGGASAGRAAPNTNGPMSVLNLSIDGQKFNGLRAPEHVASQLKSYAVSRQSSSAQKMPSWMR